MGRMYVPEYGSETSMPLHMTKRFLLLWAAWTDHVRFSGAS